MKTGENKPPPPESLLIDYAKNGDVNRLSALLHRYKDETAFNINSKELFTGNTALIWAAKRGHGAVVQLLLKYDCDVTLVNNDMQTAIDVSPNAIRKILIENGNRTSPFSYQLLHQACWQGSGSTVRRLLSLASKSIDVRATNIEGYTALQLATRDILLFEKLSNQMKISYDPLTTVRELLTNGFIISDIGRLPNKKTPLHLACSSAAKVSEKVVQLLLNYGAIVSLCDVYNFTPLHCAAFSGNCPAINLLIKKNANVNAMASKGSTPLHLSAMAGMEAAVDLLLKCGADPSIKDNDQETPVDTSKTRRIKYILEGKAGSNNRSSNTCNRPTSLVITKQEAISRNKSCTSLLEIQNNLERQKSYPNVPMMSVVSHMTVTSTIPVAKHGKVELHFVRNFRETSNLEFSNSVNGMSRTSRPTSSSRYQWKSSPNVSIFSPNTSINRGFLPSISSSTPRITSGSSMSTERSQSGNFRIRNRNLLSSSMLEDSAFLENSGELPIQGRTSSKTYIEDIEDMDSGIVRLGSGSDAHILNEDLNTIHEASEENASLRGSSVDLNEKKLIPSTTALTPSVPTVAEELTNRDQVETAEGVPVSKTAKSNSEINIKEDLKHVVASTITTDSKSIPKSVNRAIKKSKAPKEEPKGRTINNQKGATIRTISKIPNTFNKTVNSSEKNKITVLKDLDKIDDKSEITSDSETPGNNGDIVSKTNEQKVKPILNKTSSVVAKKKVKVTEQKKANQPRISSGNKANSSTRTKVNKNSNNNNSSTKPRPQNSKLNPNQNKTTMADKTDQPNDSSPGKSSDKTLPPVKRSSIPNSMSSNSGMTKPEASHGPHRLSIPNSFVQSKNNSSSTSPMMHSPPPIASACLQPTAVISGIGWQVSTDMNHTVTQKSITENEEFSFTNTPQNCGSDEEIVSEIDSVNYEDDFEFEEDTEDENDSKFRNSSPTIAEIASTRSRPEVLSEEEEEEMNDNSLSTIAEKSTKQFLAETFQEEEDISMKNQADDKFDKDEDDNDINLTYTLKTPRTADVSLAEKLAFQQDYDFNSARSSMSIDSNHGFYESIIPDWRRGKLLGTGSFGKVWCILTEHGEQLAVKEIHYDSTQEAKHEVQNIQEEIEILKTVKHRNIVRFYGTSSDEGVVYIFMEYVPGGSLANALSQFGAFGESVFRRYTKQLVEGVSFLHSNNVMHRDIKGANIMLMPSGIIKLIDFGCAKRLHKHLSISNTGSKQKSLIGSPYWMAPEVIKETGHGRKSDVWSIGCTVFEMAKGKPPWGEMQKMAAIFAIGSGDSDQQPTLSDDQFSTHACEFVKSCMTRDVASRPTASDLLQHPFLLCNRPSCLSGTREWTMIKSSAMEHCSQ